MYSAASRYDAITIVSSAERACSEPRSSDATTATVEIPSSRQARKIRSAISPRFATSRHCIARKPMLRAVNPTFMLGGELEVRRLGFGAMRIVDDREEGVRVLRRAVELGVTLVDTADIYGAGLSEEIVAEALHPYPEGVVIATKGGLGHGLQDRIRDGRPEYLRRACDASLRRLKLERIDLYQLHRHDPEVPIEESVGALHELRKEGKIRLIGVSNVSLDQLRAAQSVARIVSVQNEFNRGLLIADVVLEACASDGIAFIPWRPLGEGLRDSAFELRWLLDHSPVILPIPGTSKVSHLEENMRVVA